jgi:ubiquinone/menaquinone biosynthesis C-methylase UbiE
MSKFKEPKHAVVENGRKYRPHIKLAEGGVENIPFPTEQRTFDKVTASASLHHFPKYAFQLYCLYLLPSDERLLVYK